MNTLGTLARHVDYRRMAAGRASVDGTVELSTLPRVLAETAAEAEHGGVVTTRLEFSEDRQRRVHVAGTIEATLTLECQRCLEPFDELMSLDVAGIVVGDDEAAANVPRADEPILAGDDTLDLHALVSDELLLAMPGVARCRRPECVSRHDAGPTLPDSEAETENFKSKDNPFAMLSQLKRDN